MNRIITGIQVLLDLYQPMKNTADFWRTALQLEKLGLVELSKTDDYILTEDGKKLVGKFSDMFTRDTIEKAMLVTLETIKRERKNVWTPDSPDSPTTGKLRRMKRNRSRNRGRDGKHSR